MNKYRELRLRKGFTQVQAAVFCEVSLNAWILWEKGAGNPNDENAPKVEQMKLLPDKESK